MILDAFKIHSAVVQLQYAEAFILWDRAGEISRQLNKIWPDLRLSEGQPNQQTLVGKGVNIQTGLSKSTITISGEHALNQFSIRQIAETYDIWRKNLEIAELKRVSTRVAYLKDFPALKNANAELLSMGLVRWPDTKVFDQPLISDQNGVEVHYRFEDENSFSLLKLKAEQLNFKMELDPYWIEDSEISKQKSRMVIDFDRGLLGSVNAEKFRMDEWLKGYQHILRRDIEKVLGSTQ